MAGVDVDTLTMEQYLALSRENQAPGVVKPEIGGNVNFEIKSQFMRELREDTFSGNKDEDAHDHIDRVLSIVGLFNIPRVTAIGDWQINPFLGCEADYPPYDYHGLMPPSYVYRPSPSHDGSS
ncbi:hypothetical protein Tco_0317235 [Tanacetum coccineum]